MTKEQERFWKILSEPSKKTCVNCVYNMPGHPANITTSGTIQCQPMPCWSEQKKTYTQWIWDEETL